VADQGDELTFFDVQIDVAQRMKTAFAGGKNPSRRFLLG
jgi:hypothetical protein